jgi:hypothetical protein
VTRAANSLGLDEELDDIQLLHDVALSFGVRLAPDEAAAWRTVGDIYGALMERLSQPGPMERACATALTFRHLRTSIAAMGIAVPIRPETPLKEIARFQPRHFLKTLGGQSGLRMPDYVTSWPGLTLMAVAGAAAVGYAFGIGPLPVAWPYALLALALAVVWPVIDPGRFPSDCRTMEDLTEKVAGLNYARLRKAGAASDGKAIWRALVSVLSEHTRLSVDEITPETRLA